MRSLLRALSCIILLAGCGDPLAESTAGFSYHVVRSNGEELTIAGSSALWELVTITTLTGSQTVFALSLGSEDGDGDNLLSRPSLQIESRNDDLARTTPATGVYHLVLTGDQYFRVRIGTLAGGYVADAGTVTMTESSESTVKGRLSLHFKSDSQNEDIPTFDLTGDFTAKRIN